VAISEGAHVGALASRQRLAQVARASVHMSIRHFAWSSTLGLHQTYPAMMQPRFLQSHCPSDLEHVDYGHYVHVSDEVHQVTTPSHDAWDFVHACEVVTSHGYTPVKTDNLLRLWLLLGEPRSGSQAVRIIQQCDGLAAFARISCSSLPRHEGGATAATGQVRHRLATSGSAGALWTSSSGT
jgi:hypothetical protein